MKLFMTALVVVASVVGFSNSAEARYLYKQKGWFGTKLVSLQDRTRVQTGRTSYTVVYADDESYCQITVKGKSPLPCEVVKVAMGENYEGDGRYSTNYELGFALRNAAGAELLRQLNSERKSGRDDLSELISRYEGNGRTSLTINSRYSECAQKRPVLWKNQDIQIDDHESADAIHLFSKIKRARKK